MCISAHAVAGSMGLEGVVLVMKDMGVDKVRV